jgi:ethanolamine utilization protein EutN
MNLGKVTGCLWASAKHKSLLGAKLMIVSQIDINGKPTGAYEVAYDTVDAGVGDTVITVKGSSAKMTPQTSNATIDCAITGIVDHVQQ